MDFFSRPYQYSEKNPAAWDFREKSVKKGRVNVLHSLTTGIHYLEN